MNTLQSKSQGCGSSGEDEIKVVQTIVQERDSGSERSLVWKCDCYHEGQQGGKPQKPHQHVWVSLLAVFIVPVYWHLPRTLLVVTITVITTIEECISDLWGAYFCFVTRLLKRKAQELGFSKWSFGRFWMGRFYDVWIEIFLSSDSWDNGSFEKHWCVLDALWVELTARARHVTPHHNTSSPSVSRQRASVSQCKIGGGLISPLSYIGLN